MLRAGNYLGKACALTLLASSGCALHPAQRSAPQVPAALQNVLPAAEVRWPGQDWYHGFGSAELDVIIGRVSAANLDLVAARARVQQADARARQAGRGHSAQCRCAGEWRLPRRSLGPRQRA